MANCNQCKREFSEEDKATTNYRQYMGDYYHQMCPGETCFICHQEIESYAEAKTDALMRWQHKGCKPVPISPEAIRADEAAIKDEMIEEAGYDAATWIVKGKRYDD